MTKAMARTGGAPTQRDLAERFGISQAAVSQALHGKGRLNPKLVKAVVAAAREAGYTGDSHYHARMMAQSRHGVVTVANVVCALVHNDDHNLVNGFSQRLVNGILRGAEETGSELIIAPRSSAPQFPRVVLRRQVDGVVWLLTDDDFRRHEPVCPVPVASLFFELPGADCVAVDNRASMVALGERLAALGHRFAAFIGPAGILARERLAGVRAGLAAGGGCIRDEDVRIERGAMSAKTTVPLVRAIMDRRTGQPPADRVTALVVYNDFMAAHVVNCIRDTYGLAVPGEISITGFDGVDVPEAPDVKLTTLAVPLEQMGIEAVRLISRRMRQPEAPFKRIVAQARLIEGDTLGRPSPIEA